jgi:intracellular multiplication protein IcmL
MSDKSGTPEKNGASAENGVYVVEESRAFYRDSYQRIVRIAVIEAVVIVGLLIPNVIDLLVHSKPVVIAVNPSMQVQPVVPLTEPMVSNAGVSAWATRAAEKTLSLSFTEWKQELSSAAKYYTSDAFKQLIIGLKSSGILQKINDQRLNTVLQPVSAAYVEQTGRIDGIPAWMIKGDMILTYEGSNGNISTQNIHATIVVQRANILKHPSGLIIRNILLQ